MRYLTKSKFVAGMECPLKMWNQYHRPELASPPSETDRYRMATGIRVTELACNLHPGGVRVDVEHLTLEQAADETRRLIEDDSVPAIFEATFVHDDLIMRSDILERLDDGAFNLIEVKSSTSVREEHHYDVWFQSHVLERIGLPTNGASLRRINNKYIYEGNGIDHDALFADVDMTVIVSGLDAELQAGLDKFRRIVASDQPPAMTLSRRCRECEFFGDCGKHTPKQWTGYLPLLRDDKYRQLSEMGIHNIAAIPADFKLSGPQTIIRNATAEGNEWIGEGLGDRLADVAFPMYFLDFETCAEAIPRFAGTRSYQQIPFQWSCHILNEDGEVTHREFLHSDETDPREAFVESLCTCIGNTGSVVHYTSFEKTHLRAASGTFPALAPKLNAIMKRLYDLCQVIQKGYYHPDFVGSYSIKDVLPVLVPDLSYDELDINDGQAAGREYLRMIDPATSTEDKQRIRKNLLIYCGLDTLAMVKIYEVLKAKAGV